MKEAKVVVQMIVKANQKWLLKTRTRGVKRGFQEEKIGHLMASAVVYHGVAPQHYLPPSDVVKVPLALDNVETDGRRVPVYHICQFKFQHTRRMNNG